MIKVSVMYPSAAGARFDHEYYRDRHMPMVKEMFGKLCLHYTVDRGLARGMPDAPTTYVAMCHVFFDSEQAFQDGMAQHGKEIFADIAIFTDLVPVVQISEVVVG